LTSACGTGEAWQFRVSKMKPHDLESMPVDELWSLRSSRIVASVLARISIPFDRALASISVSDPQQFFFPQVEQAFWFEGFHRFDYSLSTGLVSS
jgi:hypothetical protein